MSGIFIRTVPNVMQHFGCSQETAQRFCDLREEGHGHEQAKLMAGLSDPPEPVEPRTPSVTCWALSFMCAELRPRCLAAGKCVVEPPHERAPS